MFDPAAKPSAPWPTGDASTDKTIDGFRDTARKSMKPADPSQRQAKLEPGTTPGLLDAELESCPQARDALKKVADAPPDQRRSAMSNIADGIAACDCKADIPRVRALLYINQRGPD